MSGLTLFLHQESCYALLMRILLWIFIVLTLPGPLFMLLSGRIDLSADYRTANQDSAHLTPLPKEYPDAIIQVYSARAFNWRGLFAVHTWIAIKPKNAKNYTVAQVVGWLFYRNQSPLSIEANIPDRNWFDQKPELILDIRGKKAEALIPQIKKAIKEYTYSDTYSYWPGPNSNTFTAHIGRTVPELGMVLPGTAIGKDYFNNNRYTGTMPSGTGYQFSLKGLFSIGISKKEGLEINLLGLVYGIRINPFGITLPGLGSIPHYKIRTDQ